MLLKLDILLVSGVRFLVSKKKTSRLFRGGLSGSLRQVQGPEIDSVPGVRIYFLGVASLTRRLRPSSAVPFRLSMAVLALSAGISTKAKPRERPVSRSVIRLTDNTSPYSPNSF